MIYDDHAYCGDTSDGCGRHSITCWCIGRGDPTSELMPLTCFIPDEHTSERVYDQTREYLAALEHMIEQARSSSPGADRARLKIN